MEFKPATIKSDLKKIYGVYEKNGKQSKTLRNKCNNIQETFTEKGTLVRGIQEGGLLDVIKAALSWARTNKPNHKDLIKLYDKYLESGTMIEAMVVSAPPAKTKAKKATKKAPKKPLIEITDTKEKEDKEDNKDYTSVSKLKKLGAKGKAEHVEKILIQCSEDKDLSEQVRTSAEENKITIEDMYLGKVSGKPLDISKWFKVLVNKFVVPNFKSGEKLFTDLIELYVDPKKVNLKGSRAKTPSKSTPKKAPKEEAQEKQEIELPEDTKVSDNIKEIKTISVEAKNLDDGAVFKMEVDEKYADLLKLDYSEINTAFTIKQEYLMFTKNLRPLLPRLNEFNLFLTMVQNNEIAFFNMVTLGVIREHLSFEAVSWAKFKTEFYRRIVELDEPEIYLLIRKIYFILLKENPTKHKFWEYFGYQYLYLPLYLDIEEIEGQDNKQNKSETIQFVSTPEGVSFFLDGEQFTTPFDDHNFQTTLDLIQAQDHEGLRNLVDTKINKITEIEESLDSDADVSIVGNKLIIGGVTFVGAQVERYIELLKQKSNTSKYHKRFLTLLAENPEVRAQEELYNFMQVNKLPITNNGTVLLYKSVRNDYMDSYSGTLNNAPGKTIWMKRSNCNSNSNATCSNGLHLCSCGYGKFSQKMLITELNPRDCVSIPREYGNSKMRCCEYKVLIDITEFWDGTPGSFSDKDFLACNPVIHHDPIIIEYLFMKKFNTIKRKFAIVPSYQDKSWDDLFMVFENYTPPKNIIKKIEGIHSTKEGKLIKKGEQYKKDNILDLHKFDDYVKRIDLFMRGKVDANEFSKEDFRVLLHNAFELGLDEILLNYLFHKAFTKNETIMWDCSCEFITYNVYDKIKDSINNDIIMEILNSYRERFINVASVADKEAEWIIQSRAAAKKGSIENEYIPVDDQKDSTYKGVSSNAEITQKKTRFSTIFSNIKKKIFG